MQPGIKAGQGALLFLLLIFLQFNYFVVSLARF